MDELEQCLVPASQQGEPEILLSPPLHMGRRLFISRNLLPFGIMLMLLVLLVTLLDTRFTICLTVQIDGESVGMLSDEVALEELVGEAQQTVESLTGEPFEIQGRISYSYSLISNADTGALDANAVEKGIYDHIEEIDMLYVITVDGQEVGYLSDLTALRTAMDARLEALIEEGWVSARYLCDVEFDYRYVKAGQILDQDAVDELAAGLKVETVEQVTYTKTIPYTVDIIQDENMYTDDTQVLREGENGEAQVTAEITYIDGREAAHSVVAMNTLTDAVSEIILEGTQMRPLTASTGEYIWPVAGTISSYFGPRNVSIGSSNHQGIDIACPADEYVYAADGGEVIFAGWCSGYGNLVQIQHDNGDITYYGHNNSIDVAVGDKVYQGQLIARAGSTGNSTGNHVHFEIRIDGEAVDPLPYLPE